MGKRKDKFIIQVEEIEKRYKAKLRPTLRLFWSLAEKSERGYFYIDTSACIKELGICKKTLYNHINKLSDVMFKVYQGGRVLDDIAKALLQDTGRSIAGVGSLYFMPAAKYEGGEGFSDIDVVRETEVRRFHQDIAILSEGFRWERTRIQHFFWWAQLDESEDTLEILESGFSRPVDEALRKYFKYMVRNDFNWNAPEYDYSMDQFFALAAEGDRFLHSI